MPPRMGAPDMLRPFTRDAVLVKSLRLLWLDNLERRIVSVLLWNAPKYVSGSIREQGGNGTTSQERGLAWIVARRVHTPRVSSDPEGSSSKDLLGVP